ncbi:aldo/keto reductase [Hydrogenimonas sp.]
MRTHPLGFGTYRVTIANESHVEALIYALRRGVRIVDTSTNYAGGDSERAVGEALRRCGVAREAVTVVSKAGYIQGKLLQEVATGRLEVAETVPYQEGCWHSIHPDFLRHQLEASLARTGLDYLDTYLLHNPEYFLMHTVESAGDVETARREMTRRIFEAFIALEEAVAEGRIRGYGISSNAFAKKPSDPHFLPYTRLVELAEAAAAEAGNPQHRFTTIQLPLNLLERQGLACAAWAKAQGLTVLVNRPLNAFDENGMRRLAQYPAPEGYEAAKNALLETADAYSASELRTVVTDLDTIRGHFTWPGAAEETLARQVVPFIQGVLGRLPDPAAKKAVIPLLNPFLDAWREEVAHLCGEKCADYLREKGVACTPPIQRCALRWLASRPEVDTVLLGMRKKAYVDDALLALESPEGS